VLRYQDTSTGQVVAAHRTKLGPCDALRQNPWNAVLCLGHGNGGVTMWTPNLATPAVRMLCHHGPVRSLAADPQGRHLVTTGADGQVGRPPPLPACRGGASCLPRAPRGWLAPPSNRHVSAALPLRPARPPALPPLFPPPCRQVKVWDLRMLRPLHAYFSPSPAEWCDISQRGLLAVGYGRRVQVWRDALASKAQSPYMTHRLAGGVLRDFHFCPYEVRECVCVCVWWRTWGGGGEGPHQISLGTSELDISLAAGCSLTAGWCVLPGHEAAHACGVGGCDCDPPVPDPPPAPLSPPRTCWALGTAAACPPCWCRGRASPTTTPGWPTPSRPRSSGARPRCTACWTSCR
jgi:hypothetical protein